MKKDNRKIVNKTATVSTYRQIENLDLDIDEKLEEIFKEHPKAKIKNITSTVGTSYLIAIIWYQYREPCRFKLFLDKILMSKSKRKEGTNNEKV